MSKLRKIVITALIIAFLWGCWSERAKSDQEAQNEAIIAQRYDFKDPLDVWIDKLGEYECKGCPDNFRILDVNGKYSYGKFQFQEYTFISYIKRYNLLPLAEDKEILNSIYDTELQKRLVKLMIAEDPNNWKKWYTSVKTRGLGIPPNDNTAR